MTWQHKYSIEADNDIVFACHMISDTKLAMCMTGHVAVYEVGTSGASHLYRVAPEEWKGRDILGVAVSESSPGSMFAICNLKKCVYQCPCEESSTIINKYIINASDKTDTPWCITANINTAVLGLIRGNSLIVCKLPRFTQQSQLTIDIHPYDLTISTSHLMVMDMDEIVVKPLDDVRQNVCRITPPDRCCKFNGVCHRHKCRELYVGCKLKDTRKGCVYKYTWDGVGKPQYVNPTCIIDGIDLMENRCLSVTSGGLLALRQLGSKKVLIYKLQ